MCAHFGEIRNVTDMAALSVLIDVFSSEFLSSERFHHFKGFQDRARIRSSTADVINFSAARSVTLNILRIGIVGSFDGLALSKVRWQFRKLSRSDQPNDIVGNRPRITSLTRNFVNPSNFGIVVHSVEGARVID